MSSSRSVLAVLTVLGLVCPPLVPAQWMGGQLPGGQSQLGGAWGGAGLFGGQQQQDEQRFLTCTAANSNNDDMRITFSTGSSSNNPWGRFGMMGNRFANAGRLRLEARVTSGTGSQLQGQYQLVVTRFSRSEEVCLSRALGDILSDNTPSWWGQRNQRPRGMVGTPIRIMSGQTATSSETVDNMRFDELAGRGMALCPAHQISGTTCMDTIPLCCKIGFDSQRATTPFTTVGAMFQPSGGFAMQNGGFGGDMNAGGLNQGFAQPGFDQGLNAGRAMGGQGRLDQGMTAGLSMGGRDQGLVAPGFGGVPAQGQGQGLAFKK